MAFRKFDTSTWDDPWFEELPVEARYVFIYLWTTSRCNQSGMYEISLTKIAKDTLLPVNQVQEILGHLQGDDTTNLPPTPNHGTTNPPPTHHSGTTINTHSHILYFSEKNIIFVKNFLKHQCQNKNFAESALKIVMENYPEMIQVFVESNLTILNRFGVQIPPTPHQPPTMVPPTPHHGLQNRTEQKKNRTE